MITFSVNSDLSKDKAKKVFKLIQDMNSFNRDYIGEAYIHLMTGDSKNINLDSYAKLKKIEEHRELTKYDTKEENIVDIDDLQNGDIGTISNELFDPKNYEEISIERADIDYYVDEFLSIREYIFFKGGKDIWRMLCLAFTGDKIVTNKLRMIFDEYKIKDFMYEFLSCPYYMYVVKMILG